MSSTNSSTVFLCLTTCLFLVVNLPQFITAMPSSESQNQETRATKIPMFVSRGKNITARENSQLVLDCNVDDLGEYVLLWSFIRTPGVGDVPNTAQPKNKVVFAGHIPVQPVPELAINNETFSLIIKRFTSDLIGTYSCSIGGMKNHEIYYHVTMMTAPVIVPSPLQSKIHVRKNDGFTLKCNTKHSPSPVTINWSHKGKIISSDPILEIPSATSSHEGVYICVAKNDIGAREHAFKVEVLYEPEINIAEKIIHGPIGDNIEVRCDVKANPLAEISWQFSNNSRIHDSRKHMISTRENHSVLRILNVDKNDYDTYYCMANNSVGSQQIFFEVTGKPSKPKFKSAPVGKDGDSYQVEWTVFSQNPITSYELRYREVDHATGRRSDWRAVSVKPINDDQGPVRKQAYRLENLSYLNSYELELDVSNSYGSTRSDKFVFATLANDQIDSLTMEETNSASTSTFGLLLPIILIILSVWAF